MSSSRPLSRDISARLGSPKHSPTDALPKTADIGGARRKSSTPACEHHLEDTGSQATASKSKPAVKFVNSKEDLRVSLTSGALSRDHVDIASLPPSNDLRSSLSNTVSDLRSTLTSRKPVLLRPDVTTPSIELEDPLVTSNPPKLSKEEIFTMASILEEKLGVPSEDASGKSSNFENLVLSIVEVVGSSDIMPQSQSSLHDSGFSNHVFGAQKRMRPNNRRRKRAAATKAPKNKLKRSKATLVQHRGRQRPAASPLRRQKQNALGISLGPSQNPAWKRGESVFSRLEYPRGSFESAPILKSSDPSDLDSSLLTATESSVVAPESPHIIPESPPKSSFKLPHLRKETSYSANTLHNSPSASTLHDSPSTDMLHDSPFAKSVAQFISDCSKQLKSKLDRHRHNEDNLEPTGMMLCLTSDSESDHNLVIDVPEDLNRDQNSSVLNSSINAACNFSTLHPQPCPLFEQPPLPESDYEKHSTPPPPPLLVSPISTSDTPPNNVTPISMANAGGRKTRDSFTELEASGSEPKTDECAGMRIEEIRSEVPPVPIVPIVPTNKISLLTVIANRSSNATLPATPQPKEDYIPLSTAVSDKGDMSEGGSSTGVLKSPPRLHLVTSPVSSPSKSIESGEITTEDEDTVCDSKKARVVATKRSPRKPGPLSRSDPKKPRYQYYQERRYLSPRSRSPLRPVPRFGQNHQYRQRPPKRYPVRRSAKKEDDEDYEILKLRREALMTMINGESQNEESDGSDMSVCSVISSNIENVSLAPPILLPKEMSAVEASSSTSDVMDVVVKKKRSPRPPSSTVKVSLYW